mmetsp:Transcript_25607/g.39401  ORF Transcript_25607/g.39401 Transcript_25607/m.39401 type:complete len:235 (-) Transcript_25607:1171-1875(-)
MASHVLALAHSMRLLVPINSLAAHNYVSLLLDGVLILNRGSVSHTRLALLGSSHHLFARRRRLEHLVRVERAEQRLVVVRQVCCLLNHVEHSVLVLIVPEFDFGPALVGLDSLVRWHLGSFDEILGESLLSDVLLLRLGHPVGFEVVDWALLFLLLGDEHLIVLSEHVLILEQLHPGNVLWLLHPRAVILPELKFLDIAELLAELRDVLPMDSCCKLSELPHLVADLFLFPVLQ